MKHVLLTTLLLSAPLAAQAHWGPAFTNADLIGATAVSAAIPQPDAAPALSEAVTVPTSVQVAGK